MKLIVPNWTPESSKLFRTSVVAVEQNNLMSKVRALFGEDYMESP